jgi:integrase
MRGQGRVFQRGPKWWIAYYHRGEEHRQSAGPTKKHATDLLKARLAEIATGRFGGLVRERLTVGDVLRAYVANLEATGAKSIRPVKSSVRHLWERFSDIKIIDWRGEIADRWVTDCKAEGYEVGTIAQRLARLQAAFTLAHQRGDILFRPYVPTLQFNNVRQGFLVPEDCERFVAQLPAPLDDVVQFAYATGWRREEILKLQWTNIDFRAGEIRLVDTKNGQGRVIPMYWKDERTGQRHMLAFAKILERRRRLRALTPWVFHEAGEPLKNFDAAWRRAARAAGLPYMGCQECAAMPRSKDELAGHLMKHHGATAAAAAFTARAVMKAARIMHDFRRSAVRNMEDAGVPRKVAMMVTGHRSESTYERYNIRTLADVAKGLRRTELYVERTKIGSPADEGFSVDR